MPLSNSPLSSLPIIVFDTETTGLFTMSAWMVEIAGVRTLGSFVTTGVFQTLVCPDAIIPPDATKVHGITDDEVRDSPPTADVLRAFFDWAATGRALKPSGEPFRTIDDIIDDLGYIPEEEEDGPRIILNVPLIAPIERPYYPFEFTRDGDILLRRKQPCEPEPVNEPRWNKAAPPGVPIDIPYIIPGDGEVFEGVYKGIDGIERRIPGVRDFPELRGENPDGTPIGTAEAPKPESDSVHTWDNVHDFKPAQPGSAIFAAHNAPYDLGILATAFRRTGLTLPADFVCIDTCAWARKVLKLKSYSLSSIVDHIASSDDIEIPFIDIEGPDCLGIEAAQFAMQGFHRALCDSLHTAVVLSYLMQTTGMDRDGSTLADLNERYPKAVVCGIPDHSAAVAIPRELSALTAAIARGADATIAYVSGATDSAPDPPARTRKIKPLGVYDAKGVAYLEAFCYKDGFVKTFRVDRIREARKI